MQADKVSQSSTATFMPTAHNGLAARLQGKQANHNSRDLSPLLGRRWSQPTGLQEKQQQMQAKYEGNPAAAFSGSGHSIPSQQKYSQLLGKDLSSVKLHTGPQVDAALASNGLQGLTDGTQNIAVSSTASSGTLEHEITHIGQPTVTEGTRAALESHADKGAQQLMSGKAVDAFGSSSSGEKTGGLQGKCNACEEKKEKLQGKEDKQQSSLGTLQAQGPSRAPHPEVDDLTADTGGVYLNFFPCCVPGGLAHHIGLSRANAAGNPVGSMGFYPMDLSKKGTKKSATPGGVAGHVQEDTSSHAYSIYIPSDQIDTAAVMAALNTTRTSCGSNDPTSSLYCKYSLVGYTCGNYASDWLKAGGLNISGHFNPDSIGLQVLNSVPGSVRR